MERRRSATGIGEYVFIRNTGQGQFGKVKLALHKPTGQNVAIKIINKHKLSPEAFKMVNREIRIMKMLWHPNIVRLYEVIETESYMYLVMEYASGGEVMDYILAHGKIVERDACKFFAQTAYALQYCHAQKTVHRDIKAENLLLDAHMNIKLIDFGLSYVFNPSSTLKTFCGSPAYAAPEVMQRHEYTGPEVDCWSLGVLLYMLVCGELPFTGSTFKELYLQIVHNEYTIPDFVSPLCRDLISKMLVADPKERATISQIVTHPWVVNSGLHQPAAIGPLVKGLSAQKPLDTEILDRMVALGIDKKSIINSIVSEKYDDFFATYYLLCAKRDAAARSATRSSSLLAFCLGPYSPEQSSSPSYAPLSSEMSSAATDPSQAGHLALQQSSVSSLSAQPPEPAALASLASSSASKETCHVHNRERRDSSPMAREFIPKAVQPTYFSHQSQQNIDTPHSVSPFTIRSPKVESPSLAARISTSSSGSPAPFASVGSNNSSRSRIHDDGNAAEKTVFSKTPEAVRPEPEKIHWCDDFKLAVNNDDLYSNELVFGSGESKIRSMRFPLNPNVTTAQDPETIVEAVEKVLKERTPPIEYKYITKFFLECDASDKDVSFEIEVCKLPHLSMNGIRFHKMTGSTRNYRFIYKYITENLPLLLKRKW